MATFDAQLTAVKKAAKAFYDAQDRSNKKLFEALEALYPVGVEAKSDLDGFLVFLNSQSAADLKSWRLMGTERPKFLTKSDKLTGPVKNNPFITLVAIVFPRCQQGQKSKYAKILSHCEENKITGVAQWIVNNKGLENAYNEAKKSAGGTNTGTATKTSSKADDGKRVIARTTALATFDAATDDEDGFKVGLVKIAGGKGHLVYTVDDEAAVKKILTKIGDENASLKAAAILNHSDHQYYAFAEAFSIIEAAMAGVPEKDITIILDYMDERPRLTGQGGNMLCGVEFDDCFDGQLLDDQCYYYGGDFKKAKLVLLGQEEFTGQVKAKAGKKASQNSINIGNSRAHIDLEFRPKADGGQKTTNISSFEDKKRSKIDMASVVPGRIIESLKLHKGKDLELVGGDDEFIVKIINGGEYKFPAEGLKFDQFRIPVNAMIDALTTILSHDAADTRICVPADKQLMFEAKTSAGDIVISIGGGASQDNIVMLPGSKKKGLKKAAEGDKAA